MPKKFFTSEKRCGQRLTGKPSHMEPEAVQVETENHVYSFNSSMDMDFQDKFDDLLQKSGSIMAKTPLSKQKKMVGVKTGVPAKRIARQSKQSLGKGRGKPSDCTKMQRDKEKAMENILSGTIDTSSEDSQSQIDNILQEFDDNVTKSLVPKQKKTEIRTAILAKRIPRQSKRSLGKGRGKPSDGTKMQRDKENAMENILSDTVDISSEMDSQSQIDSILQKFDGNVTKSLVPKQKKTEIRTGGITKRIPRRSKQSLGKGRGKPSDGTKMQRDKEKAMENILSDTVDTSSEMDSQNQIDNVLQEFDDNVTKSLVSKQKKTEIQGTSCMSIKEMLDIFEVNQTEQKCLMDECRKQLAKFFEDANATLKVDKENQMQLEEQMKQYEEQLKELIMQCTQGLETLRKTTDTFFKKFEELNENHEGRLEDVQNNLAQKLQLMEKKVKLQSQAMTISKLRKNLRSFFE